MCISRYFKASDEAAQEFLSHIEFGHVVSNSRNGLISTFIPLIYKKETNAFLGHFAKLNYQPKTRSIDQAPPDYVEGQIRASVGIELKLSRIEVSFKMSQNKSEVAADGVIAGLIKAAKASIAVEI